MNNICEPKKEILVNWSPELNGAILLSPKASWIVFIDIGIIDFASKMKLRHCEFKIEDFISPQDSTINLRFNFISAGKISP